MTIHISAIFANMTKYFATLAAFMMSTCLSFYINNNYIGNKPMIIPKLKMLNQESQSFSLRKLIGITTIVSSLGMNSMNINAVSGVSSTGVGKILVDAIEKLESTDDRQSTIQNLADLFEAAGEKTLLARTKYKYRIIKDINDKHVKLSDTWDKTLSYEGKLCNERRVISIMLNFFLQFAKHLDLTLSQHFAILLYSW